MTDLTISVVVEPARPVRGRRPRCSCACASTTPEAEPVHAMVLKAQIRIEPQRRRYSPEEESPAGRAVRRVRRSGASRCGRSCGPTSPPPSPSSPARTEVDLPVPCTYDFEVAAAKYLHSLGDGEIPLVLLFNGTMFSYRDGGLVVQPIAWNVEAEHRLPVAVWRATMDAFFPNSGWIRLRRETIDALTRYKSDRALTSWEDAFERLLKEAGP